MSVNDYRICTRGVWDSTIPGISFDKNGASNYSKLMDKLMAAYPRGELGLQMWLGIAKKIKETNKNRRYNCIIGVSGGTDSSYLLCVAKEYGLRPLAVNLDNGWNSDISVKNIRRMTDALNIDLETYVIDYEEIKMLFRSYMKAGLPWIDMPSDLAIKAVLYKIAAREKIKYILRGNDFRSEGTQPREWTYGDGKQLKYISDKFGSGKIFHSFPNYTLSGLLWFSLAKGIKTIYPYYYLEYTKKNAQTYLKDTFQWEYYGGHHFENIFTRFVISVWLIEKFGIDKRKITYSAQILNGEISREEALALLSKKPVSDSEKEKMVGYVMKKLDFVSKEFEAIMKSPNKSFYDYPSDYKLIDSMSYLSKAVLNKVFIHKPQSLFQSEMRKEKY
jgi:N-acetyl sugar amidotransferase